MTHTGSPKLVVFGPYSVKISDISNGKMIEKGVANHSSKAYECSHFLPYSYLVHIGSHLKGKLNLNLLNMIIFH